MSTIQVPIFRDALYFRSGVDYIIQSECRSLQVTHIDWCTERLETVHFPIKSGSRFFFLYL